MSQGPGLAQRLYHRAMGVGDDRLTHTGGEEPRLPDVLYYASEKGFWSLVRGALFRFRLRECGGRFFLGRATRVLFPGWLRVGRNVAIGDHVYMNCFGGGGVSLGDNVRIREFGWVQVTSHLTNPGQGLEVGDNTYVGPHCYLGAGGRISIGRSATFGGYVHLLAENHRFEDASRPAGAQGVERAGIVIQDGVWLGNGVIVLDGVTIGAGAVVGAGSVVTHDVPPRSVVAGNPARVIRML